MSEQPSEVPQKSTEPGASGSAIGRVAQFAVRHPIGIAHSAFFVLVAIVVLQNLEPTSIDVLFWKFASVPKLVLIFFSMIVGAAAWELARRLLRRR
jgi:uncharacterized integral membrane protein